MLTLDCSTRDKALLALAAGFKCSTDELRSALLSIDIEFIYETDETILIPSWQYLREHICNLIGEPEEFADAYWFHGTRTTHDNQFSEGLLTLGRSEKLVMDMLISHAPTNQVRERLQAWNTHGGVPEDLYQMRTLEKMHWGPYGHLVREVHLHAQDLSQHDYVWLPELVEDVCRAYKEYYQQDLTKHYLQILRPCIVWFRSEIQCQYGVLEAALSYAYTSVRGLPPDSGSVYGVDKDGVDVPHRDIFKIEFI